jgi:site-specific DNA-methyltransferase (adenine-specific)
MKWGTGALNIDGCRITTSEDDSIYAKNPHTHSGFGHANAQVYGRGKGSDYRLSSGRWPANLVHDGSEEVLDGFPAARSAGNYPSSSIGTGKGTTYLPLKPQGKLYSDSGSAARFFYCAKASKRDRRGSKHPTIKPVKLIQWLVRLVTPPNGTVLDIFAGSGTTGEAAYLEGFSAVLIELEAEYQADIKHRIEAMFNENEHLTKLKKIAKEFPDMEFKCQFP